jgi:hypothetical protein
MRNFITEVKYADFSTAACLLAESNYPSNVSGYFRMLKEGQSYYVFVIQKPTSRYGKDYSWLCIYALRGTIGKVHKAQPISSPVKVAMNIVENRRKGYQLVDGGYVSTKEAILQLVNLMGGIEMCPPDIKNAITTWKNADKEMKKLFDDMFSTRNNLSAADEKAIALL